MEGRPLSAYLPGFIYEVPEAFGRQLIAMDAAIEVRSTDPAISTDDAPSLSGGVHVMPPDKAED